MAQGKKTNAKTIADTISDKMANPEASSREIAQGKNISHVTVLEILKEEAPELLTTSTEAKTLLEYNLSIIAEGARKIELAMKRLDPETIRDTKEYQTIVDTAFKQNQLIEWKATVNVNVLWDVLKEIQGIE